MSVGRGVGVSVSVGMEVNVSVGGMLVDVEKGSPCGGDAGIPPALLCEQANVVNIRTRERMYFKFFMA